MRQSKHHLMTKHAEHSLYRSPIMVSDQDSEWNPVDVHDFCIENCAKVSSDLYMEMFQILSVCCREMESEIFIQS